MLLQRSSYPCATKEYELIGKCASSRKLIMIALKRPAYFVPCSAFFSQLWNSWPWTIWGCLWWFSVYWVLTSRLRFDGTWLVKIWPFFSPLLLSLIIYFSSFILQLIILPDDTPISAVEPRTHVQHAQVHSCRTHDIHDSPCISRVCARANHIIHSPHLPFTLKRPTGNYRTSHSSASLGRMFSKPYISLTECSFP